MVIATDAGREGELIARLILEGLGWRRWDKTYRLWTSEALTPGVVRREMSRLKEASRYDSLYESALARLHADWVVGINYTRLVTLKAREGGGGGVWSVGRVQTPTLRLVVEREEEIGAFRPEPYAEVWATFLAGEGFRYEGVLFLPEGPRLPPERGEALRGLLAVARRGRVEGVEREERALPPPSSTPHHPPAPGQRPLRLHGEEDLGPRPEALRGAQGHQLPPHREQTPPRERQGAREGGAGGPRSFRLAPWGGEGGEAGV